MPRDFLETPPAWKEKGVLYVVDIENNRAEYDRLRERLGATAAATSNEVYTVRVVPYSGNEYQRLLAEKTAPIIKVTRKNGRPEMELDASNVDALEMMEQVNETVLRVGIREVFGFRKWKVPPEFFNDDGSVKEGWRKAAVPSWVKTGEELVEFVSRTLLARPDRQQIELQGLQDIQRAIQDESHLEAGMVKESSSTPVGSPAVTRPSVGDAPGAKAQRTSTTRKGRKKTTSARRGTATD